MDPSKEAEKELRRIRHEERERDLQRMEEEVVWPQIMIAIAIVFALWALDKYLEDAIKQAPQQKVQEK